MFVGGVLEFFNLPKRNTLRNFREEGMESECLGGQIIDPDSWGLSSSLPVISSVTLIVTNFFVL